jgi:aspartate aminotransferase
MTVRLSKRAASLTPSSTAAVGRAAKALAAKGVDVVDFGVGEPDFATPEFVGRAGVSAIERGLTKYTDNAGEPGLREAIAEKYRREQGAACSLGNVVVTAGAKQAVFNVCQALFQEGDEVVVFSPYWVSFPEIVRLAGATPVLAPSTLESGWKPTAARLERAASPRTRGVILNSPNNPTGAVVETAELERILAFCRERQAFLLFDETYDRFLYDGRRHVSAAHYMENYGDLVVVTGAASKTWAMTGWRLGWVLGPAELATAISGYQSHSTSNASSISQEAARAALTDLTSSDTSVGLMLAEYAKRREVMVRGLLGLPGARCSRPEGAFYAFPDLSTFFARKGVRGSAAFCDRLLSEAHVAAVPGDAFGADSCVRFSYATALPRIEEGLRRLARWLSG